MSDSDFQPGRVMDLAPGVRRITAPNAGMMTGPGSNTYLIGEDEVAVIDPAMDNADHLDAVVRAGGGRIRWILVTHNHPDHSGGAATLSQMTGAPVLAHPTRLTGVRNEAFVPDETIEDGHTLVLDGRRLRALYTPGHSADHLCFLLEDEHLLFAGDHVMEAVTVVILPPDGDMDEYLASLARLQTEQIARIAPGHGGVMDDAQSQFAQIIAHRHAREQQILETLGEGTWRASELVEAIYQDVPRQLHPVAEQQVLAHLLRLARQGQVRDEGQHGPWRRVQS